MRGACASWVFGAAAGTPTPELAVQLGTGEDTPITLTTDDWNWESLPVLPVDAAPEAPEAAEGSVEGSVEGYKHSGDRHAAVRAVVSRLATSLALDKTVVDARGLTDALDANGSTNGCPQGLLWSVVDFIGGFHWWISLVDFIGGFHDHSVLPCRPSSMYAFS